MPGSDRQKHPPLSPPPAGDAAVRVEAVSKKYGSLSAVSAVSFTVGSGEICGLVGSDGAGKTTLLRMIATMIRPTQGDIYLQGLEVVHHRERVKELIGYMPQRFDLYQDLTVAENLDFFMDIYGITGAERQRR
jgi:ABC-2 type transport system ATP-binding protein